MHNPNVKWDDIIGLESAKRTIKEAVVYPIKVYFFKHEKFSDFSYNIFFI